MTRKTNRHANLRLLLDEYETLTALAEATGTSEKYLWQVVHRQPLPSGRPRGIGDALAEKLEKGTGRPNGWMDTDHSANPPGAALDLNRLELELIRQFRTASPAKRKAIMAVARL